MKHRATTRYQNGGKHRGKVIPQREIHRRIAQSYGYTVKSQFAKGAEGAQIKTTPHSNNVGDTIIVA